MKANRKIKWISLAIVGIMIAFATDSFSQDEYDDMYFRPDDRKEIKLNQEAMKGSTSESFNSQVVAKNNSGSDVINPSYSPGDYGTVEESYSAKNVNPEYIARYKNNPKGSEDAEVSAEGDSYYDEYYDRTLMPGEAGITDKKNYPYPSSYYGGYNASMRNRMYANSWYNPYYGGFGPSMSLGLGYTFGYMPGFSMGLGWGTGWGYGYDPYGFYDPYYMHMSRYYDPFYSPWAYDPFYGPWGYDPFYNPYGYNSYYRNMMYGYGWPRYYNSYYGYGSCYSFVSVYPSGSKTNYESNRLEAPSYRNRIARGSDQFIRDNQDVVTSRSANARRSAGSESQTVSNARISTDRDFSRSQNEYYSRSGSRNSTSTVSSASSRIATDNSITSTSRSSGSSLDNSSSSRVRSSRMNTNYSRPSYQTTREQRSYSSESSRSSWSNSGTYRSSRSSGGSYSSSPSRSGGSSFSGSSGASFRSSSSGGSSVGSYSSGSSGGSRSSGSSGSSRSSRGN